MFSTNFSVFTKALLTAVLLAAPVTVVTAAPPAYADCGDPGQDPCTGPVPTPDQVIDVLNALFNPNIPAADKGTIVTPPFTPDEDATIDDRLNRMNAAGLLPMNFTATNIQSAPNNFAGATIQSTGPFWKENSAPGPAVFVDQDGHWLITHDSAWTALDNTWYNIHRHWVF